MDKEKLYNDICNMFYENYEAEDYIDENGNDISLDYTKGFFDGISSLLLYTYNVEDVEEVINKIAEFFNSGEYKEYNK